MPQNATSASPGPDIATAMTQRATGENFPVAMRVLPARYRQHLMAVYGFARTIDDIGDRAQASERQYLMDELQTDLGRLYRDGAGDPQTSVIQALAPAVAQCSIPEQPFLDLIAANRQDQVITRYQSLGGLKGYCVLSANPVGRIVLYVFGQFTPARAKLSDRVCTALQLVEHWQDVGEDYRAGRIYLPGADLAAYGVAEAELGAPRASAALRSLLAFETQRARALLDSGAPLVGMLRGYARLAVAGYLAGGRAALAAIGQADYDVLGVASRPGKARTAVEMLRVYAIGR
ncbi:MAG: squalene synthase HpnC [Actinomycetota bacterium]